MRVILIAIGMHKKSFLASLAFTACKLEIALQYILDIATKELKLLVPRT